ncbi:MAG: hypothetical protein ISR82_01650 [Candidatus Marinimicrobia bacterium]|nr:hypothetical protein [Candidatus Neomarinimicrobiota bacterium]MBL7009911.1 hypothetical protein [Candidatus Neomarinimicrobiota bacterium]MBL7030138.1 hypothetical protein [Candidatus Neomarinimicrobiota bacterium]
MKIFIKPLVLILVNTILLAQVGNVGRTNKTLKVAYAGIQVVNVEPWAEQELNKIMDAIFIELNPSQLILIDEVQRLAAPQVDSLFLDMTDVRFQQVAEKTGAIYIFAGKFKNVSPDESRIMIQGDFYRYNANLKSSYRYEVLKYYERMNTEAAVIQKQLVDSIPSVTNPPTIKQVVYVFGGIILLGFLLMSLTGMNVWSEGGNGGNGPPPTEN